MSSSATMSSSASAAPATRYQFCHRCFVPTVLAADAACPHCRSPFVEEINILPAHAPNPDNCHLITTGSLSASPAFFVLRSRADVDALFEPEISSLRHPTLCPARGPPSRLFSLRHRIEFFFAIGVDVYVILAGVPPSAVPTAVHASSDLNIGSVAREITSAALQYRDSFISRAATSAFVALGDIEIDAGEHGDALCAVCLEDLAVGAAAKQFPCKHVFHGDCIVPWLQLQHICPVCRSPLLTEEVGGPSDAMVIRIVLPPPSLRLYLDWNITIFYDEERGEPQIPPRQWA